MVESTEALCMHAQRVACGWGIFQARTDQCGIRNITIKKVIDKHAPKVSDSAVVPFRMRWRKFDYFSAFQVKSAEK